MRDALRAPMERRLILFQPLDAFADFAEDIVLPAVAAVIGGEVDLGSVGLERFCRILCHAEGADSIVGPELSISSHG